MAEREMPKPEDLRKKYPSNSYKSKDNPYDIFENEEEKVHKPRAKQITQAKRIKKKGMLHRLGKAMLEDSLDNVKERTFNDVIVPGMKMLLFDAVVDTLDAMIFGNSGLAPRGYQNRPRAFNNQQTSYSSYYNNHAARRPQRASKEEYGGHSMDPDDVIVGTRREANRLLNDMNDYIRQYGQASIATLYDMVGLDSDWTDDQYGWSSIKGAQIRHVRDGYLIVLPPTHELER